MSDQMLSVVVPVYNEAENIPDLYAELKQILVGLGRPFEIILVDDGSSDGTTELLAEMARSSPNVRVIMFRRNFGQTAALAAGFHYACGAVVLTLDADLQNDPADIPKLMEAIERGADVASGRRVHRKDPLLTRRLPSAVANLLISTVTGVSLRDYGCMLKAYRREVVADVNLYGEMHRFLPAVFSWRGARIVEVDVNHRPRTRGKSKYGLSRILKVLLDLITVMFMGSYSTKPIRFFGTCGLLSLLAGAGTAGYLIYRKLTAGEFMIQSPLLLLSTLLVIVGVQFILMGLLAELTIRIHYDAQHRPPYVIRRTLNLQEKTRADAGDQASERSVR
jgi:glycosyltransferase involved in cell wall biosynthesis